MKVIQLLIFIGLFIGFCILIRSSLFWVVYKVNVKEHLSEYYKRKKVQFELFKYRISFFKYDKVGYTLAISVILFDLITLIIYLINFSKWGSSLVDFISQIRVNYGVLDFITLVFLGISFGSIIYLFFNSNDSERDFKHDHNDLIDWSLPDYTNCNNKHIVMSSSDKQSRLLKNYIGKSHYTRFGMAKIIAMNSEELRGQTNSNILCVANEEIISLNQISFDVYKATLFDYLLSNVVNDKKICDNFSEEITHEISISEHTYIYEFAEQKRIRKLPNNSLDSANPLILRSVKDGSVAIYLVQYDNNIINYFKGDVELEAYLCKLMGGKVVINNIERLKQQKELIVVDVNLEYCDNYGSLIEISNLLGV